MRDRVAGSAEGQVKLISINLPNGVIFSSDHSIPEAHGESGSLDLSRAVDARQYEKEQRNKGI